MPLLSVETIHADVQLGLWKIDETEEQLAAAYPQFAPQVEGFRAVSRRLERWAVLALTAAMTGSEDIVLRHAENGAPQLDGWHISISHTKGYAAVILSCDRQVAVDVEYVSPRVATILHKFLSEDETPATLTEQLLCWCAKETVYKLFPDSNLQYTEMHIRPFLLDDGAPIMAENRKNHLMLNVYYRHTEAYALTYAFL